MDSPKCLIENVDGVLRPVPDAIDHLMKIRQRVVVVAVVGLYRTGKSYLMNKLAGRKDGFALGDTIQSKTKGIWMWCVPHPKQADLTLVLLDTEGLGDVEKGDSKNDAWIFSLAILLSSTLVYNSRGTIDNQAVENLQYVTELTERIKVKSSSNASSSEDEEEGVDAQFVQFFPNFVWAVRDFTLQLRIDNRDVTADQYLEHSLELKKGTDRRVMNFNLPRACIRNYFPTRKCFVFQTPASPENMVRLESMDERELCQGFRETTDTFCNYIFQMSRVKTVKGGQGVTGRMLGHLVKMYVETIARGEVPCLENVVLAMAQIENQAAVEEGLKLYQSCMEPLKTRFPVDMDQMSDQHQRADQQATQEFMNRSFKDGNGEFLTMLANGIAKNYAELLIQNDDASEKKCQGLLRDLSTPVSQKIQEGFFATPGGYELYCDLHDKLVAQYRSTPNKGIRAEEVLERFLKEKSVESNSILQADQKLTDSEKMIHEERERAAVAEQEVKVEQEKRLQLERESEERERSYQESVTQMEAKMELEANQMKWEMERALESKLEEQKKLHERGFLEKETDMKEEITALRHKMEEAKSEREDKASYREMMGTLMHSIGDGLGHYFNYKQAREKRKAIQSKTLLSSRPRGVKAGVPDTQKGLPNPGTRDQTQAKSGGSSGSEV
ncbi:guanylate-binding protein 1-like isoform X1 [Osmerus eperlanus]|uniref:guanylate-binding protein 1-like isoform X1 n=1 Tax=Osmerus eperlanus TaxID=29151 RepID=UPI002E0D34F0